MKSVCLLGYYGAENFGDEILLASTIELLDSVESFRIHIFTGNEQITSKQYPFYKAIPKFNFFAVFSSLVNSEALILGGGSLFQDVTSLKSIIYYFLVVFLAKMLGKKIVFLSQGIGPLNTYWGKFFTQCSFQMADWVSVRDNESLKFAKRWNSSVVYAPDLAWLAFEEEKPFDEILTNDDLDGSNYVVESETNLGDIQKILISLRSDKLKERELEVFVNVLNSLFPEAVFSLVALQATDLKALEKISKNLKKFEITKLYELEDVLNKFELNQLFKEVDLAICMRFHAVLTMAALSLPTCALAYDPKVDELCKQLNLPFLALDQLQDEESFAKFLQNLESKIPPKKDLVKEVSQMATLTKEINSKIINNLVDELGE